MTTFRALAPGIVCALASVFLAPRLTHAGPPEPQQSRIVRFPDLQLDSQADVVTLLRRIETASRAVCTDFEPYGSLVPSAAYRRCVREAVAGAVRNVDSPLLTAYYDTQVPEHSPGIARR